MWNLETWSNLIFVELMKNGTKKIVQIGANDPNKWMEKEADEIPYEIFWSWLVLRDDSDVDNNERDYFHESSHARSQIEEMVDEVVQRFLEGMDEEGECV